MKRIGGFVPTALVGLEPRVLLSHASSRGLSVVVGGLYPGQQVLSRRQSPIVAEVNQAFDTFQSDYQQARSTYFTSIQNDPTPSVATMNAFMLYTRGRVSLLAQEVISSYLQSPLGASRGKGAPSTLQQVVSRQLINPQGADPHGSLAKALLDAIPPPGTSASTASLYTLTQDNAIESARVAVINGVSVLRNGDFGNGSHGH